jgi:hypothetical protein
MSTVLNICAQSKAKSVIFALDDGAAQAARLNGASRRFALSYGGWAL